jgi:hypothetical protein
LFQVFLRAEVQFFVPCLAEFADQRLAKKTVCTHIQVFTQRFGVPADFPPVEIDRRVRAVFRDADGVQVTRNGFAHAGALLEEGFLDGAPAYSVCIVTCEYTVFSIDYGSDDIAFRINVADALALDHGLRSRREVVPHGREAVSQAVKFVLFERCARVAFDATRSFTARKVARKVAFHQI